MKIIKFILIVTTLFLCEKTRAQLSSFNWSDTVAKEGGKIAKIINLGKRSIVVFKPTSSSIRFDVFDDGKNSSENVRFRGEYLDVFKVGNSVVVFSKLYNNSENKDELLATVIHEGNVKEIKILDESLVGRLHSKFKICVSPDFNHVAVVTEKPHVKGHKEAIVFTVLNNELAIQRSSNFVMNTLYSQKRRRNVPIINNNGEVYLLKRYKTQKRSKYYVLGFSMNSNISFEEFKLSYNPIKDVQYSLDKKGYLIIGGTYTSSNSVRSLGTYIAKIDIEGNRIFRKEYGYRYETMLDFTSEKEMKKNGLGLHSFRSNRLVLQKENIILIVEHRLLAANSKTRINTDMREGLIVCSYDLDGNFTWDKSLMMHQTDVSEKGYWNSFICFNDTANNNLSIIYNEVGYLDKKADNEFGENTVVGARVVVIDNQGNSEKEPIKNCFKGAPISLVLSPKINIQKGAELFILAEPLDKSVYVFGVVE